MGTGSDGFDALFRAHFRRLRRLSDEILRDHGEAEDVAQEALLRAWVQRDSLRAEHVGAWLSVVARNLSFTRLRARSRSALQATCGEELAIDVESDPTSVIDGQARRSALSEALDRLNPRHRAVLLATYVENEPRQEVAAMLGLRSGGLRAVMFRARETLRRELDSIKDQLWGIAFGFRCRMNRVTRRFGGGELGERTLVLGAGAGVAGLVIAAVVGGLNIVPSRGEISRDPSMSSPAATRSKAWPDVESNRSWTSRELAATQNFDEDSGDKTLSLGVTSATRSSKGIDSQTNVPGPKGPEGEPFIQGNGYVHGEGTEEPREGDLGFLIAETVCDSAPMLC